MNALNLELADLQAKFTATRAALDRAEGEALPRAQYEIQSLQEALQREQATVGRLQADVHQLSGQAATAAEEAASLRASLSARIAERDEEIEKLRRQLVARQKATASVVSSSFFGELLFRNWFQFFFIILGSVSLFLFLFGGGNSRSRRLLRRVGTAAANADGESDWQAGRRGAAQFGEPLPQAAAGAGGAAAAGDGRQLGHGGVEQ